VLFNQNNFDKMNNYIAYQSNPDLKLSCIHGMQQLIKANKLSQDQTWDVKAYANAIQTPLVLAELIRSIFMHLPRENAFNWAITHLEAIPVGKDLSKVWPNFKNWLIFDPKDGLINQLDQGLIRDLYLELHHLKADRIPAFIDQIDTLISELNVEIDPLNSQLYQLIVLKSILLEHVHQLMANLPCLFDSTKAKTSHENTHPSFINDYDDYMDEYFGNEHNNDDSQQSTEYLCYLNKLSDQLLNLMSSN
jgi:hypothetical protein